MSYVYHEQLTSPTDPTVGAHAGTLLGSTIYPTIILRSRSEYGEGQYAKHGGISS
jgi:hypothetical protein